MDDRELSVESNAQQAPLGRDRDFAVSKRSRGRSGCLNCRRRRKKCDESKPACAKCTSRGESCKWDTRITFRLSGIGTYDPSMAHPRSSQTSNNHRIINVTFDNSTSPVQHSNHDEHVEMSQQSSFSPPHQNVCEVQESHSGHSSAIADNDPVLTPLSRDSSAFSAHESSLSHFQMPNRDLSSVTATSPEGNGNIFLANCENSLDTFPRSLPQITAASSSVDGRGLSSARRARSSFDCLEPLINEANAQVQPLSTFTELEALDYLTSHSNSIPFLTPTPQQRESLQYHYRRDFRIINPSLSGESISGESPDSNTLYHPSAAYQDLHMALYHHMVETARNTTLTRQASPNPISQEAPAMMHEDPPLPLNVHAMRAQIREPALQFQPLKAVKLTPARQMELWRNYLDEIAVWLDMFDNDRNFQFKIPLLAKSADHLHYSILALSARQKERKGPDKTHTESLALYQEAIKLIVKELYTLDTTVIASCVLLCVLEMMSSSPKAWCRHLDGCAMLLEAAGVNGVVGGLRQSLFWCFARMDVWGGFLEDTLTKIPTSRWFIPSGSMIEAVTHFKAGSGSHGYANYAVFLCASVVNVISNHLSQSEGDFTRKNTYSARWRALFNLLEDWYMNRPEEMQPFMANPSNFDNPQEPFPAVLYGSSPAINGNQLYHAAALLMLQDKPKGIRLPKSPRSILWHARQICGIAVSNSDHGAWINSLQPLWIAGKIMSHETEHQAILNLLALIEKDTGWATAWRADDLRDYWGDV